MARDRAFREWRLQEVLPAEIDVATARDIVLDCFYTVHGAHFEATKAHLGVSVDEKRVRQSAKGALRLAFRHTGGSYDAPTKAQLEKVMEHLDAQSRSWGTPEHLIRNHRAELQRVIARIREN
ncbi:MAG: hypothetical protein D9V44_02490 [Actinobacteria bacterium]|nr:MAG: hypothetical protein D9V44_02490 [Actinomycetota bacterium]